MKSYRQFQDNELVVAINLEIREEFVLHQGQFRTEAAVFRNGPPVTYVVFTAEDDVLIEIFVPLFLIEVDKGDISVPPGSLDVPYAVFPTAYYSLDQGLMVAGARGDAAIPGLIYRNSPVDAWETNLPDGFHLLHQRILVRGKSGIVPILHPTEAQFITIPKWGKTRYFNLQGPSANISVGDQI